MRMALKMSMMILSSLCYSVSALVPRSSSMARFLPRQKANAKSVRHFAAVMFSSSSSLSSSSSSSSSSMKLKEEVTEGYSQDQVLDIKTPPRFVPYPFHYQQQIEITIDSLTNRGMGIGRIEVDPPPLSATASSSSEDDSSETDKSEQDEPLDKQKWVVMVHGVIPGETVLVKVFRNFPNYSEADFIRVAADPSPERVTPPCPYANDCGGCQWQHMSITMQREWKTRLVHEGLQQYGVKYDESIVQPCFGTNQVLAYRSKLTPHFQQPKKSRRGVDNPNNGAGNQPKAMKEISAIGFQKQTARQVLDVPECLIATPAINAAYAEKRKQLLSNPPQSKKGATLLFRQANANDEFVETNHKATMTTQLKDLKFTYRAGNFFQNNYYVLPFMVDQVVQQATQGGSMTHLADCYCGSGLFALSVARHFDRVVGIEVNDLAIQEATANAESNHIDNVEFLASSAEGIFRVIWEDFPRKTSVVVVDPPRKGCSEDFLDQLYAFGPQRLVYMSCDPTTQARDAKGIVSAGYQITYVQPFDLFPQTRHIECLMVFEKQAQ